jgi:hypothetical protein
MSELAVGLADYYFHTGAAFSLDASVTTVAGDGG